MTSIILKINTSKINIMDHYIILCTPPGSSHHDNITIPSLFQRGIMRDVKQTFNLGVTHE